MLPHVDCGRMTGPQATPHLSSGIHEATCLIINPPSPDVSAENVHVSSKIDRGGMLIEFSNLTVNVTDRVTKEDKSILKNVRGQAKPGRLLAIMGASGAGKSTLLDVLTFSKFDGRRVHGTVLVNGENRDRHEFLRSSCYVQQRDILLASATVRECVITSALLKLPATMPRSEKMKRVDDVLEELELVGCSNVLIGDESVGLKGVSGGQKRRVSLAIELVKDPKVVFADEPTSGLDSEVALSIIDALVQLSRKNRTVVCTIHQPNSDITAMFDDYLLLSGGCAVYGGKWLEAIDFFTAAGYVTPTYRNPTDYFMSVVRDPVAANKLSGRFHDMCAAADEIVLLADSSAHCTDRGAMFISMNTTNEDTEEASHRSATKEEGPKRRGTLGHTLSGLSLSSSNSCYTFGGALTETSEATVMMQVSVLLLRNTRNWVRSPVMLASQVMQYILLSLFIGLLYLKFTDELVDGMFDRLACVWFSFAVLSFTPAFTAITAWDKERTMLRRELHQGQYTIPSYFLAREAILLPLVTVQCVLFVSVLYFFAGFQKDAGKFFIFVTVLCMFQLISEGVGLACAVVSKTASYAHMILSLFLVLLTCFSGFIVSRVPVYFMWVGKISYFNYALAALTLSEYTGLYLNVDGHSVEAVTRLPRAVDTDLSIAGNMAVLAGIMVFMELVKLVCMYAAYYLHLI